MAKNFIIANWKMNQTIKEIDSFFEEFNKNDFQGNFVISPQSLHMPKCIYLSKNAKIAAQNISHEKSGAFTGEISPIALKEMSISYAIIGHSERRAIFKEDDQLINAKVKNALAHSITPILCIGETLEQRDAGKTLDIVLGQIKSALKDVKLTSSDDIILAYEPVWAIGTGKTATSEEASSVHDEIRSLLVELSGDIGKTISILYGGSVKPNNIDELLEKENINGALVGGASLQSESFSKLCKASI